MRFRPFHFLLLAAIVYWTSGAALFLHERFEHAHDGDDVAEVADSSHSAASHSGDNPKHHHDDHDDCPTCQLLAHMQAEHVAPPVVVCCHLPSFSALHVTDRRPPTVDSVSFIPIRGPPVLAGHFIV